MEVNLMNKQHYIDFYEQIIGFDNYIEIRNFYKSGAVASVYFKDAKTLIEYIQNNKNNTNIYCGVNPRKEKGRKLSDITHIKNIVFDIEAIGQKQELIINNQDTEYFKKLKKTMNFIYDYLSTEFNLEVSCVVTSGRGLHAYITLKQPVETQTYKQQYKKWYKQITNFINQNNPCAGEIKCDPMVSDASRILGAPGSKQNKYQEQPTRNIIHINTNTNNQLLQTLEQIETTTYNKKKKTKKHKYDEQTIFNSAEFLIFKYKPLQGTQINNKLRLALKLLIAENEIQNHEQIAEGIEKLGYPHKDMSFAENEYPDYEYSEHLLNSYVLENFEWATDVDFKIPYTLKEQTQIQKHKNYIKKTPEQFIDHDNEDVEITTPTQLITEIKKFNNKFQKRQSNYIFVYNEALKTNMLMRIKNTKLLKFIKQNEMLEKLEILI
jgi:DNA segregation ATPase FtsK/SpoIIIE-like protein